MLFSIWLLLSVLHWTTATYGDNNTLATYFCDEVMLQTISAKLDTIRTENENLRLQLTTLNLIMNKEFSDLRDVIADEASQSAKPKASTKSQNCAPYNYAHLIDPRGNFNDEQPECTPAAETSSASSSTQPARLPSSCAEALLMSGRSKGLHKIRIPDSQLRPFFVYCLADPKHNGGAWTIIQRRIDGSIDFFRQWHDYQRGFGNLETEFFIGLEKLHALTTSVMHELWIELEDFDHVKRYAKYSSFAIGGASESYALNVLGAYTGDAGDSLTPHAGEKFTTKDVDNDHHDTMNCAVQYTGGWWYNKCHESNLNGKYLRGSYGSELYGKGIDWYKWHEHNYSLKYVHMAIRPLNVENNAPKF